MQNRLTKYVLPIFISCLTGFTCLGGDIDKPSSEPPDYKTYTQEPFKITISNGFPKKFLSIITASEVPFQFDLDKMGANTSASVSLKNEVTLTLTDYTDNGVSYCQASMAVEKHGKITAILIDINLDGIWDVKRIVSSPLQTFICFGNGWLPVEIATNLGSKLPQAVSHNKEYIFSRNLGTWQLKK